MAENGISFLSCYNAAKSLEMQLIKWPNELERGYVRAQMDVGLVADKAWSHLLKKSEVIEQ